MVFQLRVCGVGICAVVAAVVLSGLPALAQESAGEGKACPVIAAHELTPAEAAYAGQHYSRAEDLYGAAVAQHPEDAGLAVGLVHTWLHEGNVEQAAAKVERLLAAQSNSAAVLAAQAEVQLRQGQPWAAQETLDAAAKADPCLARVHLIRSRVLRLDSMYASERAEIEKAYAIDPTDPDVLHAYRSVVHPAEEMAGIAKALGDGSVLDEATRKAGQESIDGMMSLVREDSQTCKVLPAEASATLPLQTAYADAKHVDGYRLEVEFPKTKGHLQVDTAASGMYVSRAFADANGLERGVNDPPGTVHVDRVQMGPLVFQNCMAGVSEAPFAGKLDGFIGTDLFAQYMITLDHPKGELRLAPLPAVAAVVPGDRPRVAELRDFTPVYHRRQYLLVPVMLNSKMRRLFILDTGIRLSAMRPEVAHAISTTKVNFTNAVQTVSGGTLQIYRDSFGFEYANLPVEHQSGVLQMDPTVMDQNAGMQVAGMLGFDLLHGTVLHLDYRDGLVKLDVPAGGADEGVRTASKRGQASGEEDCQPGSLSDRPLHAAIEAKVTGLLDSAHLKPGREVYVKLVNDWEDPECKMEQGALLYGHVTAVASSNGRAELSLVFDKADCDGHPGKKIGMRIIGVVAAPDQYVGIHSVLPSQVGGGGRNISITAASMGSFIEDENLNPGGAPHTIHPGIVAGIPTMKLEPMGGVGCSDKLTTTQHSLTLGVGAELLIGRELAK